jgi:hypothetical protein
MQTPVKPKVAGMSPGKLAALIILGTFALAVIGSILFCGGCCGALSLLPTLALSWPNNTSVL